MVETTRVFECIHCHAEIVEAQRGDPRTREDRAGEFAATVVSCPACGHETTYNTGSVVSGDSPRTAVLPCPRCDSTVEAYGSREFVEHVARDPEVHDAHAA